MNVEEKRARQPPQYAEQVRVFQAHAAAFAVGMSIMFGVNLLTVVMAGVAGSWSSWWSLWALVGWSAGVAVHGLVVWINRPDRPVGEVAVDGSPALNGPPS